MKALRISMNLTQRAFGELLGITQVAETQYENGNRKIPREVRRKILALKTADSE
jgi:transcriptional regulator with XRE-family HTH domain